MKPLYLLSEPAFKAFPKKRKEHYAPSGQLKLCQQVIRETQSKEEITNKLRDEYLAVAFSLKEMGIDFRIIYAHPEKIDQKLLAGCLSYLGCKLAGFETGYSLPVAAFPRDFFTILPGAILINSHVMKASKKRKGGYHIIPSPYGEGGRVLYSTRTMLITDRLVLQEEKYSVEPKGLQEIKELGIKIGLLPTPLSVAFSGTKVIRSSINDHIDRSACLIRGKKGKPHLVLDPKISTAISKPQRGGKRILTLRPFPKTQKEIRDTCKSLGIEVHYPKRLEVPYSLNLVQFPDNRVLMTAGDHPAEKVIEKIVGKDKVFKTKVPIRFIPTWTYGGIRCLIGEAPRVMFIDL